MNLTAFPFDQKNFKIWHQKFWPKYEKYYFHETSKVKFIKIMQQIKMNAIITNDF